MTRRRILAAVGALVLLGLVVGGVGLVWWQRQVDPPGGPGRPTQITVRPGMTTASIGHLLEERGVITNASAFRWYSQLKGLDSIQAGDYSLRRRDDMANVVAVLKQGSKVQLDRLTVPEGLTLPQVAELVGKVPGRSAERFLTAARSGRVTSPFQPAGGDLEGLLAPETYMLAKNEDETRILTRMVDGFTQMANQLRLADSQARVGLTPYQTVIVASLVEREAKVDDDRGMIARVIYNRLARGMKLEIDATVEYALGAHKERLLFSDLKVESPYNTYLIPGLPPGPIASPGRESLEAALNPTPGPWLFYVLADPSGRHAFATTFQEFQRLAAESQAKGLR